MKTLLIALSLNLILLPGILNAQEVMKQDFQSLADTSSQETWDTIKPKEVLSVHIYPNPARTSIRLLPQGDGNLYLTSVEIISQNGAVIQYQTPQYQRSVDISSLESGIYIIRMLTDTSVYQSRFIKQ